MEMETSKPKQAEKRSRIYTFFAGLFLQEPSPEKVPEQRRIIQAILGETDGTGWDADGLPGSLCQEYFDCFFVPTSGKYVPPYESALREYSPDRPRRFGKLSGPSACHVQQCWDETGFDPKELVFFEPLQENHFPDHIGLELAFMAFLCGKEEKAGTGMGPRGEENANRWRNFQRGFLHEHLSKLSPPLAEALRVAAPGFFARVAEAVSKWVAADLAELASEKNGGNDLHDS